MDEKEKQVLGELQETLRLVNTMYREFIFLCIICSDLMIQQQNFKIYE